MHGVILGYQWVIDLVRGTTVHLDGVINKCFTGFKNVIWSFHTFLSISNTLIVHISVLHTSVFFYSMQ